MRKIVFALALALPVVFCSCVKDEVKTPEKLQGTSWVNTEKVELLGVTIMTSTRTYVFSETNVSETLSLVIGDGEPINSTATYSYAYVKPNVSIVSSIETLNGVVDGDKMTISDTDGDGKPVQRVFIMK